MKKNINCCGSSNAQKGIGLTSRAIDVIEQTKVEELTQFQGSWVVFVPLTVPPTRFLV